MPDTPTTMASSISNDVLSFRKPHPSEELEFSTIPAYLQPPPPPSTSKHETTDKGGRGDKTIESLTTPIEPGAHHYEFYDFITSAVSSAHADSSGRDAKFGGLEVSSCGTDELFFGMQRAIPGFRELARDTQNVTEAERDMTFVQGLRMYPKAIFWSVLLSCTLVMEGYDLSIVNGFFALPEFVERYGVAMESGYEIKTAWQAGLTNGAVCGEILGLLFNGSSFFGTLYKGSI